MRLKAPGPMSTRLRLFPLNAVLFPGAVLNLHVFEPRYKELIGECLKSGEGFGVVLIRDGEEAGDPSVKPHEIGSIAQIVEVTELPFGRYYVSTVGRRRFRIRRVVSREPYLTVEADVLREEERRHSDVPQLRDDVHEAFLEYQELIVQLRGTASVIDLPADANETSFIVGDALQVADALKQRLLETNSTKERLGLELDFLRQLLPQVRELIARRAAELASRKDDPKEEARRSGQQRYFGKYFSSN